MKRKAEEACDQEPESKVAKHPSHSIDNLPKDVLISIFSFLDNIQDVFKSVSRTSKSWLSVIKDEEHSLFKSIVIADSQCLPMALQMQSALPLMPESDLLLLVELCKKNKVEKWIMDDGLAEPIQFTVNVLNRMVEYKLFQGIKVLEFNDAFTKVATDTILSPVAQQCAGTLEELVVGSQDHYNSFLVQCAATLKKLKCTTSVTDLPDNLVLNNLEHIIIGEGRDDYTMIQNLISKCPNLLELDWGDGDYAPIDADTITFVSQNCLKFQSITLGARYLKEMDLIRTASSRLTNLKELIITDGYYYDDELQEIGQHCKKLEKFVDKCEDMDFDNYTYENLLRDIGKSLKYLDIRLPYDTLEQALEELPKVCPNLETLSLTSYMVPLDGVNAEDGMEDRGEDGDENGRRDDMGADATEPSIKLIEYFNKIPKLTSIIVAAAEDENEMSVAVNDAEVEKKFRRNLMNKLVTKYGLRHANFASETPKIVELDNSCLYRISNVHPDWTFEAKVLPSSSFDDIVLEVTKKGKKN
jgi:hypothetical protein